MCDRDLKPPRNTSEIPRLRGRRVWNSLETCGRSKRLSVIVFGILFKAEGKNVGFVKISFSTIRSRAPVVGFE